MAVNITDFKNEVIDMANSLTKADKVNFNNVLYKSIFEASEFAKQRKIVPGVRTGNTVVVMDNTENYNSFPAQDGCDDNECDLDVKGTPYKWELADYNCKVPICLKTFDNDFLQFFNTWKTDNGEKGLNTALVQYLFDKFRKNANAALWTKGFVAEKNSSNSVLKNSNGHLVLAEAGGGEVITMTENAEGSEKLVFDNENAVYNYLNQMYEHYLASDWFDDGAVFEMNKKAVLNYVKWLTVNGNKKAEGCCIDVEKVMKDKQTLSGLNFHGVPIKVRGEYDKISKQVLGGKKPHYIMLAKPNDLLMGTEQKDKFMNFDLWYSKDHNKIFMRGELNMGAALPTEDYILVY